MLLQTDDRYLKFIFVNPTLIDKIYSTTETAAIAIYESESKSRVYSLFAKIPFEKMRFKERTCSVMPILKSDRKIVSIHPNMLKIKMTNRRQFYKLIEMTQRVMNLNGYTYLDFDKTVHIFEITKQFGRTCEYVNMDDILITQYDTNCKYWQYGEDK
jgi:hypothetical protein